MIDDSKIEAQATAENAADNLVPASAAAGMVPERVVDDPQAPATPGLVPAETAGTAAETGMPAREESPVNPPAPTAPELPDEPAPDPSREGIPGSPALQGNPPPPVPMPAVDAEKAQNEGDAGKPAYWRSVLTGNPATVPAEVRGMAGADDDSLDPDEQDYRLFGAINRSWAVDHLGLGKVDVRDNWKTHRARLASSLGVADDEHEVFLGLSAQEEDKPRREAARRIYEKAYLDGLHGEEAYDIRELRDGLDERDRDSADALGLEAYEQGMKVRERWMPLAEIAARGVDAFSGAEEDVFSAPRVFAAVPDLAHAVDELADLNDEDRETVLYLAARMARRNRPDAGQEGLAARMVRAARRGAGNIGLGVAQALNHAGIVTLSNVGEGIGGDKGRRVQQLASAWDKRLGMAHRLRGLLQQEIAPLYPADSAKKAESYLIDAAEATPSAAMAFCGGAGFASLAAAGMGESVSAARSLNPQGDHELQLAAGVLGGAVQGAIYMGMGRLGGRMMEQAIGSFLKSRGAGLGAFSMNALKSAGALSLHGAELIAAGKLAHAADLGSQEVAARLSGTASNIDWKAFGDNLTDIEANMREAAATLPFLLIGSGRVGLRHFRSRRSVLGDGMVLKDWGIDGKTRESIMTEQDIDKQNSLLRDALRNGRRWSAPSFLPEIVRAMGLLNGDYFNGFKDISVVRDFLRLPAETDLIEKPQPQVRDATAPEILEQEGHFESRNITPHVKERSNFAEVMRHWDRWYQLSHVGEHTPRKYFGLMSEGLSSVEDDRMDFYTDINLGIVPPVPNRMRNAGFYAPRAEAERRAFLRDRIQEVKDLSHQFIMSTFSVDSMVGNEFPPSRLATHIEKTRVNMVGQVARAVLEMAAGRDKAECAKALGKFVTMHCVRRRYRGATPAWMARIPFRNFYNYDRAIQEFFNATRSDPADYRNVMRVISGMNACARNLLAVLPMTSDFQTALTRGMGPLQAYNHILVRELGFDPKKITGYPLELIESSRNDSDMERFYNTNRANFDVLRRLSGQELEQCQGEDGRTYWRVMRPDGFYTRWHQSERDAINDLGLGMSSYFNTMGRGIVAWLRKSAKRGGVDLNAIPHVSYRRYTGFDQLCATALQDLADYWQRTATRTQPGFVVANMRRVLASHKRKSPTRVWSASLGDQEPGVDISVDNRSCMTPYALATARFRVFWERMFKSGFMTPQEAGSFLVERGYLSPERCAKIIDLSRQLPYPKNPDVPLIFTPPPDIAGMNREMSREMARYHSVYFLADLDNQKVPESVRRWVRMVPFCPQLPEKDYVSHSPHAAVRIRSGPGGITALSWMNRMTAKELNAMSAEVQEMRRRIAESPLPEGKIRNLFHAATGEPESQRYEQGWCYSMSGPGIFRGTPQKDWHLMLHPKRAWELMNDEERSDVRDRLLGFCQADPPIEALDAIARGEEVDYVQAAIDQLDRMLERYPQLHRYAPVRENDNEVRVLSLKDAMPEEDPDAEPLDQPVPLRWLGDLTAGCSYKRLGALPGWLRDDSEARSSLRFLDALRHMALGRPYALGSSIWWNAKPYGGLKGTHPVGLEAWDQEEPLEELFNLLRNVRAHCKLHNTPTLDICGVQLQGENWCKEDFDELASASVYRSPQDRSRVYRLMPGYPDSPNVNVRTPYMVACHSGTYMRGNRVVRGTEDMAESFCPLEYFHPSFVRHVNDKNLEQWRNVSLEPILDSLVNRPAYIKAVGDPESGIVGMGELLLRLCEDTGFCHSINSQDPGALSEPQAHIVNVASAILDCLRTHGKRFSLIRLSQAVEPIINNPGTRAAVLETLHRSSDLSRESTARRERMLRQLEWDFDSLENSLEAEGAQSGDSPDGAPDDADYE